MRKTPTPSPLRDAAEALDRELERYGALAAELRREPATSEKSLRRSARILQGLGEAEQLLGQCLAHLIAAIDGRRRQQESTVAEVQRLAAAVGERARRFAELMERWDALARRAAEANAVLQRGVAESATDASDVTLEHTAAGLEELAREAQAIGDAARDGEFADVARSSDGLRAQMQSAHRKVVALCERVRQGRVVH
jgi:ABC-type transporter Mla subunit MlaD